MDFAYKAVLTSTAVALALVAARTFGDKVAGLLAGLPFTTLPALVWTGTEVGPAFAAEVAIGSVLGCGAAAMFALVYERAARRFGARLALSAGLAALLGSACIAHALGAGAGVGLASGFALLCGAAALSQMRRDLLVGAPNPRRPGFGIALTALSAGAISALISALAVRLSAPAAGLLAALPVVGVTTVWVEHLSRGPASVAPFLRGYVITSLGKAAFGSVFAMCVMPCGLFVATIVALLAGALICAIGNRWSDAPTPVAASRPLATPARTSALAAPQRFSDTAAIVYADMPAPRIAAR